MVTLRVWYREAGGVRMEDVKGASYGVAFDIATMLGAWRALDGLGQVWRRIEEQWYSM